jgi:hypothetical protein
VNILEWRRYSKEIARFAARYEAAYVYSMTETPTMKADTETPTMTADDVRSGVRAIAQAHRVDEKIVAADVRDVVNKWVDKNVRLGPSGMKVPRFKTPRELVAEGQPDAVAEIYPEGGSVEELLPSDDEPPEPHTQLPPPPPPRD